MNAERLTLFRRVPLIVTVSLLGSLFVIPSAAQTSTPSILILFPFRTAAMPYAAAAESFKTTLSRDIGKPLNIYEQSLDLDRFPSPPMQSELAEFLKNRFSTHPLDLIVPIGAPAANFTLRFGQSVFPGVPILFLSADRRLVDLESLPQNATTVNQVSKTSDWLEDILQMAPDTTNIAVVLGASPTEQTWKEIILRECQAFNDRVNLTFLNGMSLDEIEKQASAMPPHSFILLAMVMRDGAGVTFDGYTVLERLRAVSNVPIYGVHESTMGRGIVGGRLLLDQTMGILAGRSAARILKGEPAASIPDQIVPNPKPVYDWRELNRWRISESRLPVGSSILFRQPTFWELYQWRILGVVGFSLLQTLLILGLLVNLRKRHRAEQSLQQRNRYIETILEESPIGFAVYSVEDGLARFVSSRFEQICCVPRGTIDSRHSFFDKVWPYDPDLREQIRSRALTDMASGDVSRMHWDDLPVETATGEIRYINTTSIHVPGQNVVISTVQDVTDHVRAQEALRESEERLRLAAAAAEFGAYSYDPRTNRVSRSPELLALHGLPAGSKLKVGEDFLPEDVFPEDKAHLLALIKAAKDPRGSGVLDAEYRIVRADGQIRWLRARGRTNFSDDGQPLSHYGIVQDITERKTAEEALRLSEERFRQVAETLTDFVWEVDANGLYIYTSPSVERILGYTPDEIVGRMHFYDLFAPDVREQLKRDVFAVFESRQPFHSFANSNLSKSGRTVYLETSGVPIVDEAGQLLGYRGADTDVTDRRQAELEAQLLRQELAVFSRAAVVSELATSIAHELNQPLAAILTNAQAALRLIRSGCPDLTELREIFDDIVADDQRAAEVIRSIRVMLKRGESDTQPLSLNNLITDVVPIVRNDALMKQVSIVLDLASSLPSVEGNRIQLQQVILNLAVNALEAMQGSQQPRKLVLRTRGTDGEIMLDVMDSGPGIPADKLTSIFEPFFTTKTNGLGMGLPLSRSITIAHKGRLWAENGSNRGAIFHLALPKVPGGGSN